ncbi:MAG: hypothetical protein Q9227_003674 [Pyrenula ochraceoflavens]
MSAVGSRSPSAAGQRPATENTHDPLLNDPVWAALYEQNLQKIEQGEYIPGGQHESNAPFPLTESQLNTARYFQEAGNKAHENFTDIQSALEYNHVGVSTESVNGHAPSTSDLASFEHFLTPEQSSENIYSDYSTHTTPNVDDFHWQQPVHLENENGHINSLNFTHIASTSTDPESQQQTARVPDHKPVFSTNIAPQLLSPQLTSTPSPPSKQADGPFAPEIIKSMAGRRPYQPQGIQTHYRPTPGHSGASSNNSMQASPKEPIARAVSPSIMVSSYNRGDSPSRADFFANRSVGKRSRASSRASSHLAPTMDDESSSDEDVDPLEMPHHHHSHTGVLPSERGNEFVSASINELQGQREMDEKKADVEIWLSKSEVGSEAGDPQSPQTSIPTRRRSRKNRIRAHSTGARSGDVGHALFDESKVPGPGLLVDEESEEDGLSEYSSAFSESPAAVVDEEQQETGESYFPSVDAVLEDSEPLPRQFYRAKPWQDPSSGEPITRTEGEPRSQPFSSNAAMMRFQHLNNQFETASRAATWGTGRRLSDSDLSAMVGPDSALRKLSLQERVRERSSSIMRQTSRLVPRRTTSNIKRRDADEKTGEHSPELGIGTKKRESLGSLKALRGMSSMGKPTSPPLNTGSAFMAMAGQMAAVGGRSSVSPAPSPSTPSAWTKPPKRVRSKSDIPSSSNKPKGTPGLSQLMTNLGGPPMLNVGSPLKEPSREPAAVRESIDEDDEEEDEDDNMEGQGIKMDLRPRVDHIIPDHNGFKTHARQLNPRLQHFLFDRIATEQVRRYKQLLKRKVDHNRAVHVLKKCDSGRHCFDLGGEATMLPLRTSPRDPDTTYPQFQVTVPGEEEDEMTTFAEGTVTAALFPPGIPLPPVKRLPAEFECTLCFKVKKFQKPSDWTKHVHEDVQPFTCTFPNCAEPKSFKRKADWVRHENERHRQLEWWKCSIPECSHICYRKDNFVQHLVREHKKPEPKVKNKGPGNRGARPSRGDADQVADWQARLHEQEVQEVWDLVDQCRYDTSKKPKDEPCKFCGNVLPTWKKLTVHLAKHMEQIAMPVLELVRQKDVSPDDIISPIDQAGSRGQQNTARSAAPRLNTETPSTAQHLSPPVAGYQPASVQASVVNRPSSEYYGPQNPQEQVYSGGGYAVPPYGQGGESTYGVQFGHYQGMPAPHTHTQFQAVNNPNATTYPPPYNRVPHHQRDMIAASPAHQQYTVPGATIPTTMYGAQSGQDVYTSPTEDPGYGPAFDMGMTQTQNMSGMPAYDPNQSNMSSTVPYHSSQGGGMEYRMMHGQGAEHGAGGGYGYRQQ